MATDKPHGWLQASLEMESSKFGYSHLIELDSFCLESALFHQLGVNLRICLCGVKYYASAQILVFLDLAKNCIFPNQKLTSCSVIFISLFQLNAVAPEVVPVGQVAYQASFFLFLVALV